MKKKLCPTCGQNTIRSLSIYGGLIRDLRRVYDWCTKRGASTFKIAEIKEKIDHNSYARFGDLIHFGFLFRPKHPSTGNMMKGFYGIDSAGCDLFFNNGGLVYTTITMDMITGNVVKRTNPKKAQDIPELTTYLDKHKQYKRY